APVDAREVIRCDRCYPVQFQTHNHLCRRCHTSLDPEEPAVAAEPETLPQNHTNGNGHNGPHLQVAYALRSFRHRFALSQRQLSLRMQVPRTYVSKIENEKATPTLSSLQRLATALEVSMADLVQGSSRTLDDEIAELMQDDFITQVVEHLDKLDSMQRSSLLSQVRDLSTRP